MLKNLAELRQQYCLAALDENSVHPNPVKQFAKWFEEAQHAEVREPNAMALATASPEGDPTLRMVLLKGLEDDAFIFYSNYDSRKGQQLKNNPRVSLLFWWETLERQVRIEGWCEPISEEESTRYFQSRPKGSQIAATISEQSKVLSSRQELEEAFAALETQYADAEYLPKPKNWGGYAVKPYRFEFWQGRESRLHDRLRFTLSELEPEKCWTLERLAP